MNAEMLKLQLKLQEKGVDVAKLQTARKTEKVSKDYTRLIKNVNQIKVTKLPIKSRKEYFKLYWKKYKLKQTRIRGVRMKDYIFAVPCQYTYIITAESEDKAREILIEDGGRTVGGEFTIEDEDYENATLLSEDVVDDYQIINGRPHRVS